MAFGKGCCLLGAVLLIVLQTSNAMKLLKESGIEDTPCDWPTGQQYWPHPTNCRMFVQCTPYGPQGMNCAPGTAWSQSLLTCDFEANTDCGKHQPTSPPKAPSTSPPKAPSTSPPESPSTSPPKAPSTAPPPENKVTCPSPFELRGHECFFVSEDGNDLLDWDESRQRCLSMGGDLAQPEDMVDFVEYIKESYPDSKSTIWLGATDREVEQEWYWVSGEPVPPAMWKPWPQNQPSGDGNCMEIHWWPKTSFYMNDWHCHNKGHFACEFNMAEDEVPKSPTTAPPSENTETTIACEGNELIITCEAGNLINLISANYGRMAKGQDICNSHHDTTNTNCKSSTSMKEVADRCSGKFSCSVAASNAIFGDPCGGTYKYLEVHYTCEPPQVCPSPYKLQGTECLFVSEDANDLLNWDESRQRCLSMGGDLAQPHNMVDFVQYIEESYPDSKSTIWLGATDREVEQEWYWVSGEPVPPAMWKPWPQNQPSGDGNCMEIHWWPHTGFYMNDWFCHKKGHFACEFNMAQD